MPRRPVPGQNMPLDVTENPLMQGERLLWTVFLVGRTIGGNGRVLGWWLTPYLKHFLPRQQSR